MAKYSELTILPAKSGQANTMTISQGTDVDACEVGHWYSPAFVATLIDADRERICRAIKYEDDE